MFCSPACIHQLVCAVPNAWGNRQGHCITCAGLCCALLPRLHGGCPGRRLVCNTGYIKKNKKSDCRFLCGVPIPSAYLLLQDGVLSPSFFWVYLSKKIRVNKFYLDVPAKISVLFREAPYKDRIIFNLPCKVLATWWTGRERATTRSALSKFPPGISQSLKHWPGIPVPAVTCSIRLAPR